MGGIHREPIYNPQRTYDHNFDHGPFGAFADPKPYIHSDETPSLYQFLGHPIRTPFGIPAGPLLNAKYTAAALAKGFDVVVYKTQRTVPFEVNPFPNVLYIDVKGDLTLEKSQSPLRAYTTAPDPTKLTITNSFGNPSRGPEFWVPDLSRALGHAGAGQLIIMSVVGTIQPSFTQDDYYDDFATAAKLAADTGVKAVEINLSCPNVAGEGILCYTPSAVREICRRVKEAIGDIPLVAKLGYYPTDQRALLHAVVREMAPHVAAISVINTIPAPVVNDAGHQALPGPGRLTTGLCGASIKWAGLEMVRRLVAIRQFLGLSYEIIGVGGVMTVADYHEYRRAGADVVQSATGAMWDPDLAGKIKQTSP